MPDDPDGLAPRGLLESHGVTRVWVRAIDHLVLTCRDVQATIVFYERALGMTADTFAGGRRALRFGDQKINLHQAGAEHAPHAEAPTPGAADFCLLSDVPVADIAAHLAAVGVEVIEGPAHRAGSTGPLTSIYFRDPDGNLVEVANPA
jgi:catechol 2,3-dioxygenase-like lactoylglutathione lyase family enzyme